MSHHDAILPPSWMMTATMTSLRMPLQQLPCRKTREKALLKELKGTASRMRTFEGEDVVVLIQICMLRGQKGSTIPGKPDSR
jgi:hypothetical protein